MPDVREIDQPMSRTTLELPSLWVSPSETGDTKHKWAAAGRTLQGWGVVPEVGTVEERPGLWIKRMDEA